MKLVLHIDRLVLRGVPPGRRDALVAELQAALTRELAQPGAAEAWAASGHRAALRLAVPGGAAAGGGLATNAAAALAQGGRR